jgi:hypothetical protein
MTKETAQKLHALAMNEGATEEERRTAAIGVCAWLAKEGFTDLRLRPPRTRAPFEDPELALDGSIVPYRGGPAWYICWSRRQAYMLARSRNEALGTTDRAVALVRFVLRRAELFGAP